jgi:hypothetical protein
MATAAPVRDRIAGEIPPARPCATCGRRDAWHRLRDGGWECKRCARRQAPSLDVNGLAAIMRHSCDRMGCHLAGEDEGDEGEAEVIAPGPPAATITVTGDSLLLCPHCRRWARVLSVATDGRLWCGRCPGAGAGIR